jgi:hypothetical protein
MTNFSSFPSSSCLVLRPKNPFALLSASSTRKMQHALRSSTLRGCGSHLSHRSSLSFTHRLPRTLELMAAASSTEMQGIRTSIRPLYPRSAGVSSQRSPHCAPFQHYHSIPPNLEIAWQIHGQARPTGTRTGFRNGGGGSSGAQS